MDKVGIFDTSPVFAHGLAGLLAVEGFEVLEVRSSTEGDYCRQADIFLVDPAAVRVSTLWAFVAEVSLVAPVLVLAPFGDYWTPGERCPGSGLVSYVDRYAPADVVVRAVRTVVDGGQFFGRAEPAGQPDRRGVDSVPLSLRERQVLRQIARGLTHTQIARVLGISRHTVDTYVKRIRSKLDLGNKAELTRAALVGEFPEATADASWPVVLSASASVPPV
ncbi:LuxR C-terminal-related transcriptional regulator [Micromonospora sp. NPDC050200]|uniref:helix-turn-helix transcriptional regulator n=1 Tax=Micromonospora sp. NPDC050200 TaxID=3155664 RepID=UPI0033C574BC